jgi:RNA polymerase sigma-70 factor (ECF subfamily)
MESGKSHTEESICALVERIGQGDREAFMTITGLYQRKVFALAYSFFRNTEDALDIVQETFLRLYQKSKMFRRGNSFQNWLLQMTKNICIDSYRKNKGKREAWKEAKDISELNLHDPKASEDHSSSDLNNVLKTCIDNLTEKQKMVFLLKQCNQMEYREIAEILDVATGTVKSLHFKALQNLRTWMSPYMESQT